MCCPLCKTLLAWVRQRETHRSGREANPGHGRHTLVNVDNSRHVRPPPVRTKTVGYCWRIYFKVLEVPLLVQVSLACLPSKKACGMHQFQYF